MSQIQLIKCPQCGSTQQQDETKPLHYQCGHCGAKYFLNDDAINIFHREKSNPREALERSINRWAWLGFIAGIIVLFIVIGYSLHQKDQRRRAEIQEQIQKTKAKYQADQQHFTQRQWVADNSWSDAKVLYAKRPNGQPILMVIGNYGKRNFKARDLYVRFYNPISGEMLKEFYLADTAVNTFAGFLLGDFKKITMQDVYLVFNKTRLYKIDTRQLDLIDVTKSLESIPQFEMGIAGFDQRGSSRDSAQVNVTTNHGDEYPYFPMLNKILDDDDKIKVGNKFRNNKQHLHISAFFSSPNSHTKERSKLMTKTYFTPEGYPKMALEQSVKNITPDRIYFSAVFPESSSFPPTVLCQNGEEALIHFNPTASKKNPSLLQRINLKNGNVLWTIASQERSENGDCMLLPETTLLMPNKHNLSSLLLDERGNIIKTLHLNPE